MVGALPHLTHHPHPLPGPRHTRRGPSRLKSELSASCRPADVPATAPTAGPAAVPTAGHGFRCQLMRRPRAAYPSWRSFVPHVPLTRPGQGPGLPVRWQSRPRGPRRFGEEFHRATFLGALWVVVCGGCGLWKLWFIAAGARWRVPAGGGPAVWGAVDWGEDTWCAGPAAAGPRQHAGL